MPRFTQILIAALCAFTTPVQADQTNADAILGLYLNPDRSRTVEVYKESGAYFGVIASAPAQPDGNEGVGFIVFRDFRFNPETHDWEDGRLDSPMRPRINVAGRLSLNERGDLVVRGQGLAALAGASVFPRVAE